MYHQLPSILDAPAIVSFNGRSPYQQITLGRVNGRRFLLFDQEELQYVEGPEEAVYHRALGPHALKWLTPFQNRVAILGGGDGLLARRLLEARRDLDITIFELDPEMIRIFRTEREAVEMNRGALEMVRQIIYGDAFETLPRFGGTFDAIFVDFPDRSPATAKLYSSAMLLRIHRKLKPGGIISMYAGGREKPPAFEDFFQRLDHTVIPGFVGGTALIIQGRRHRVIKNRSMLPAHPPPLAEVRAKQQYWATSDGGQLMYQSILLGDPGFFKSVGKFFSKVGREVFRVVKQVGPLALQFGLPIAGAAFGGPAGFGMAMSLSESMGGILGGGGGEEDIGYYSQPPPQYRMMRPPMYTSQTGLPVTQRFMQEMEPQVRQAGMPMQWFQPGVSVMRRPGVIMPPVPREEAASIWQNPLVVASLIGAGAMVMFMMVGGQTATPRRR